MMWTLPLVWAVLALCSVSHAANFHLQQQKELSIHDVGVSVNLRSPILGFQPEEMKEILEELMKESHVLDATNDVLFENSYGKMPNFFVRLQRLQRYLFATRVLPVDFFGRIPAQSAGGLQSDMPHLPRLAINRFWHEVKHEIPPMSRCLEMAPKIYAPQLPNCTEVWEMDYEPDPFKQHADASKLMVYGDLINFNVSNMFGTFDAIIMTNVFELPTHPYKALHNLHRLLKPGGLLYTTQPFIEKDVTSAVHYPDSFRFTDRVMNKMMRETGFEVERAYRIGNLMLSSGFLLGYGSADYSKHELKDILHPVLDHPDGDDGYIGTCYLARKRHITQGLRQRT